MNGPEQPLAAFSDRMLFEGTEIFRQFGFRRSANEELQANRKALELLRNSPYKEQLPEVGLFLAVLAQKAAVVSQPHQGSGGQTPSPRRAGWC
jgi:hypothetical protein